jgi:hypothetical protein
MFALELFNLCDSFGRMTNGHYSTTRITKQDMRLLRWFEADENDRGTPVPSLAASNHSAIGRDGSRALPQDSSVVVVVAHGCEDLASALKGCALSLLALNHQQLAATT